MERTLRTGWGREEGGMERTLRTGWGREEGGMERPGKGRENVHGG